MSSPLIINKESTLVLPPVLCGSIGYYALMASYGDVIIDNNCRYDKRRKLMHRYDIADVNGRLTLTIPVVKPSISNGATWNEVGVSTHGQWWNIHKVALWSAYGRTPFFEYYIDEFIPFLAPNNGKIIGSLIELNNGVDAVIRKILAIDSRVKYSLTEDEILKLKSTSTQYIDYRNSDFSLNKIVEYYQVRANQCGFIPNLSILDLIFNMGPESPLVLKKLIDINQ